jgi:hypothetical protein
MKKKVALLFLCLPLLFLMGFVKPNNLVLTSVETTVIKTERVLRYDFKIKNTGSERIIGTFDYPGHDHYGLEVTVKPNEHLESLMELQKYTVYKKMQFMGGGSSGFIDPKNEASFHLEYKIKEGSDLEKVKTASLDGTLLVLDGPKIIAEIPLK